MHPLITRLGTLAVGAAVVIGLLAAGTQDVTKVRLERSLQQTFSNLYVQQGQILGTPTTVARIAAKASCDKGGDAVKDVGAGPNWICMMDFTDLSGKSQTGKFEVAAKANYCYVAGGPSKLVGLITINDRQGRPVLNPVFEWDACYDPEG
jgi:hypothetical protein